MALKKTITYENGISTSYHRINHVSIQKRKDNSFDLSVSVASYVNEAIRLNDIRNEVHTDYVRFIVPIDSLKNDDVYSVCYSFLKNTDEFADAEDA